MKLTTRLIPVKHEWTIEDLKPGDRCFGYSYKFDEEDFFTYSWTGDEEGTVYDERGSKWRPFYLLALALGAENNIVPGKSCYDKKSKIYRIPYRVTFGAVYFKDEPDGIKMRNMYDCEPSWDFVGFVSKDAAQHVRANQELIPEEVQIENEIVKVKCPWGCFH